MDELFLEPNDVIVAVRDWIKDNPASLIYKGKTISPNNVILITDDPTNKDPEEPDFIQPPWVGIFFNTIEGGVVENGGEAIEVPILIGALCSSSKDCTDSNEALREAMGFARQIINLVIKKGLDDQTYVVNVAQPGDPEELKMFTLRCDPLPREVITASANLSVVMARFRYLEN